MAPSITAPSFSKDLIVECSNDNTFFSTGACISHRLCSLNCYAIAYTVKDNSMSKWMAVSLVLIGMSGKCYETWGGLVVLNICHIQEK